MGLQRLGPLLFPTVSQWCENTEKRHTGKLGFPGKSDGTLMLSECSFAWRMSRAGAVAGRWEKGWVLRYTGTSPGGAAQSPPAALASASRHSFSSRSGTSHWNKDSPDGRLPPPWDVRIDAAAMAPLGGPASCSLSQAGAFLSPALMRP